MIRHLDKADSDREKATRYLEGLFLGLLDDLERSTRILNDREIEKGSHKSKGGKTIVIERKRKSDDDDGTGSGDEDEGDEESVDEHPSRMKAGQVDIELRSTNRTTGSVFFSLLGLKLIGRDDQVITYPDEPFSKKESALHKLSTSASFPANSKLMISSTISSR